MISLEPLGHQEPPGIDQAVMESSDAWLPLTPGQRAMWVVCETAPEQPTYNVAFTAKILSDLDLDAFCEALGQLLVRHPILGAHFELRGGEPMQRLHPLAGLPINVREVGDQPAAAIQTMIDEAVHRPFDLSTAPACRAHVFRRGARDVFFVFVVHHLVADFASMIVLIEELRALYQPGRGGPKAAPGRTEPFASYARSFEKWLSSAAVERQRLRWQVAIAGSSATLALPFDREPQRSAKLQGAAIAVPIDTVRAHALQRLSTDSGGSQFSVVLALYQLLLARITRQTDFLVGVPVSVRRRQRHRHTVGYLVNVLPLRAQIDESVPFASLLRQTRRRLRTALRCRDYPIPLLDEISPSGRPYVFTVMLVEQRSACTTLSAAPAFSMGFGGERLELGALSLESIDLELRTAQCALTLVVCGEISRPRFLLQYDRAVFDRTTIQRLGRHLLALLASAAELPEAPLGGLSGLTLAERQQLVVEAQDTRHTAPVERLHDLVLAAAERSGDAVATVDGCGHVSYAELARQALALAARLRALAIGSGAIVGVWAEPSSPQVAALLGVLRAGATCLPLDPSLPDERLSWMIRDAPAAGVLTPPELARTGLLGQIGCPVWEVAAAQGPDLPPPPPLGGSAETLAFVFYTSGSTGSPKGVMVPHGALANRLRWMQRAQGLHRDDRVIQKASWAFDVSVWEIFWPLREGATLVLGSPTQRLDPTSLSELIVRERITTIHFVPSLLELFLRAASTGPQLGLARVFASGETLTSTLAQRAHERLAAPLYNLYGPTEAAIDVTAWRHAPDACRATVPIGRPIDNVRVYLTDPRLRPVALGVAGELVIAGEALSRGYLGRPGLTARCFVPDPFAFSPGERLYRSGDLARRLASGEIEFLGRIDLQVKIHGQRVELGEVELALERHPAVAAAVAFVRDGRLIAYFVPTSTPIPDGGELERLLRRQLPGPSVPTAILPLERLPLTPNGKLDRAALPTPASLDRPRSGQPPRTTKEIALAKVWEEVLDCGPVEVEDRFFELGGDSIRSIQVRAAARRSGLQLPAELFHHQTLAELAAAAAFEPGSAPAATTLESFLPTLDPAAFGAGVAEVFPSSSLQESLVFHSELSPDYEIYVMSLEVRGAWRPELLAAMLAMLVQRHPMLRTSFDLTSHSEPVQLVWREVDCALPVCDLRALEPADAQHTLDTFLRREVEHRFAWGRAPLLRLIAHRLRGERFQLTLSQPFLDGWSVALFLEELLRGYLALLDGTAPQTPPLPTTYRDFVAMERRALASEQQRFFWSRELAGLPRPCLPPRWGAPPTRAGALHTRRVLHVADDVAAGLRRLSRLAAVPLRSVLLAAHLRLLSLLAGRPDLVTGVISHSRPEHEGGDRVLGLFLNTVPFRLRLCAGSWIELTRRVYAKERELAPYRQYPFARLQAEHGRLGLIDTAFNFTRFHPYDSLRRLSGLQILSERIPSDQTYFPLTVYFDVRSDGALRIALDFDGRRLDEAQVSAMAHQLERVLYAMATRPAADHHTERLLPPAAAHQTTVEHEAGWQPAAADGSLGERIAARAREQPDATAVVDSELHVSYAELERRRQKAARGLRAMGAGPETILGLEASRSWSQLVAILGILETGAAFLPIASHDPPERRRRLAASTHGSRVLRGSEDLAAETSAIEDASPSGRRNSWSCGSSFSPDTLAYVMHTSGSTGEPKAVQVSRAALDGFLTVIADSLRLGPDSVLLAATPLSFDISLLELLLPLAAGGRVVLAPTDAPFDATLLGAALDGYRADVFQATPSVWRALLETGWTARTPLLALCGGAELTRDLAERLLAQPVRLCNLYGPTEATVWSTLASIRDPEPTIGRPLANTRAYVLDGWLSPLPPGSPGELFLGGSGLARGYGGDPSATAERFLPDPFSPASGARMYRTGDRALVRPDGNLVFLGRTDTQVKVRGHRIEPAEVEAALRRSPAVTEAAVVALPDARAAGEDRLVGYVVLAPGAQPSDLAEVRRLAAEVLPSSMVPQDLVALDRLPLGAHGKVDRRALPHPGSERPHLHARLVPPRNELEDRLAALWRSVLALDEVGIDDNFFNLGGSSLLLLRLHSRLRAEVEAELSLAQLFELPTIRALAARLDETAPARAPLLEIREQAADRRARLTALRARRLDGRM